MKTLFILFCFTIVVFSQELKVVEEKAPQGENLVTVQEGEELSPPPPPPASVNLTEEDIAEIYRYISEMDPGADDRLKYQKQKNKYEYEHTMQQLYREISFLKRLKVEEPERYQEALELRKFSRESTRLAETFRKSESENEREKIIKELYQILIQLFDLREKEKELEVERIKKNLERLQKEIQERKTNKEQIIQQRMNQLTGKSRLY